MPEASDYEAAETALPLPGLDEPRQGVTALELAARRSLAALDEAGLLQENHALPMQLILDLARAVGQAAGSHASAAAMAAAQLREAWLLLPTLDMATGQADEWDKLAMDLRAQADQERARQRKAAQS